MAEPRPVAPPTAPPVTRATLVCAGNLTVDESVSPAGVAQVSAGGDALFAALAARLAGGSPRVLAPLGDDAPATLTAALELAGTPAALLPARNAPTVRNVVRYGAGGSRCWTLVTGEEHFETMSVQPEDVTPDLLGAGGVLMSAMGLRAQLRLASWLRPRTDAVVYFDPQEDYLDGHRDELLGVVSRCDVFLPSEVEALALAGHDDLTVAAAGFLALGPQVVVVKRAERGCLVVTADGVRTIPADAVEPVDSTGAGDAFCGAFAAAHLAGADPVAAATVAGAVARLAVSRHGLDGLVDAVRTRFPLEAAR